MQGLPLCKSEPQRAMAKATPSRPSASPARARSNGGAPGPLPVLLNMECYAEDQATLSNAWFHAAERFGFALCIRNSRR